MRIGSIQITTGNIDAKESFRACILDITNCSRTLFWTTTPKYFQFILGPHDQSGLNIFLEQAKQIIQFGPKQDPIQPKHTTESDTQTKSLYQTIVKELEDACTENGTDDFTPACRKCKSNKFVEFEAKQTRSADEGMTIEYECTRCKIKWR